MKRLFACFGAIVVLFLVLEGAAAQYGDRPIKCYQCNSYYDKGCADFFDNRTYPLIPCAEGSTMCRKIVQETYYDGQWDIRYIRQCATRGEVGPQEGRWCKERTGNFRVKVKYCHCDNKDGCNTAAFTSQSPLLGAAVSLLGLWYILNCWRVVWKLFIHQLHLFFNSCSFGPFDKTVCNF